MTLVSGGWIVAEPVVNVVRVQQQLGALLLENLMLQEMVAQKDAEIARLQAQLAEAIPPKGADGG